MEIIDCFCGVGPWKTRDEILPHRPEEILDLMDHFGISKALIHSNFSENDGPTPHGNRQLEDICATQDRFMPAFAIVPQPYDDIPGVRDAFESMRKAESKALWFTPCNGIPQPWLYEDILGECADKKILTFINRDGLAPEDIRHICEAFPGLRVVLLGAGYGDDYWLYPLLRKYEDLHVCLGHFYIPSYGPMQFLKHFSSDRLLFGSGLPHFSPGGLITHVTYADASDDDKEKIFAGNLKRLLGEVQL